MAKRVTTSGITWYDIVSPDDKGLKEVSQAYDIHPLVIEELRGESHRSKVGAYNNYIFLVLHFPLSLFQKGTKEEVDFVIGKDFLITVRYETDGPFAKISETVAREMEQFKGEISHAGYLFYYFMKAVYSEVNLQLEDLDEDLELIEEGIYKGREREMVGFIAKSSHKILEHHRFLKSHAAILESLETVGPEFFGQEFIHHLRSILGMYERIWGKTVSHRALINDLRDTNDSFLTAKTNQTIKVLTIFSVFLLPAHFLASLFTIPASHIPIIGEYQDFWYISILMIVATTALYIYLRFKKWL